MELVEKCLPDSVMNRLRKIIFDVLYKNAPYNQGIIASEILEQAIPIIREEIQKELETLMEDTEICEDDGEYKGWSIKDKIWQDYWRVQSPSGGEE